MSDESVIQENDILLGEGVSFVGNPERTVDKYIEEAKLGKPIEFVVTTCPDYSYECGTNCTEDKAQYTFEDVGTNPGLVAEKTAETILPVIANLERAGVHNRLTFLYADTEAHDPEIREAMGLEKSEFLNRISQSAQNLFRRLHHLYNENGLTAYSKPSVNFMTNFMDPNLGSKSEELLNTVKQGSISGLALSRKELYTRWFQHNQKVSAGDTFMYNEFLTSRAKKDVLDHLLLGESLRSLTKGVDGFPTSGSNIILVTMSDDLLARYFNFSGAHPHVPVMQVKKRY